MYQTRHKGYVCHTLGPAANDYNGDLQGEPLEDHLGNPNDLDNAFNKGVGT
jgi:hypothetical protein